MTANVKKELIERLRGIISEIVLCGDNRGSAVDSVLELIDDIAADVYDY